MLSPSGSRREVLKSDKNLWRCYDWQSLLASCRGKECRHFDEALTAEAKRHEEAGDDLGHRIYALLYVIASFHPNYEVKGKIEDPEYRARVADVLWVKREGAAGGPRVPRSSAGGTGNETRHHTSSAGRESGPSAKRRARCSACAAQR